MVWGIQSKRAVPEGIHISSTGELAMRWTDLNGENLAAKKLASCGGWGHPEMNLGCLFGAFTTRWVGEWVGGGSFFRQRTNPPFLLSNSAKSLRFSWNFLQLSARYTGFRYYRNDLGLPAIPARYDRYDRFQWSFENILQLSIRKNYRTSAKWYEKHCILWIRSGTQSVLIWKNAAKVSIQ